MSETIEQICQKKGVKLTDQRKIMQKFYESKKFDHLMLMNYQKKFR